MRGFGDDIDAGAALDGVGVDGDAAAHVGPRFDAGDLVGEFVDGVDAVLRGEAGVRGTAVDDEFGFADAFARGLEHALWAEGGFEDEDGVAATGFEFDEFAGGVAADFFVGGPEEDDAFAWLKAGAGGRLADA